MTITRRGLIGIFAAACAPALIRTPGLLMPIRNIETFGPSGLLTPKMIANEMARQLTLRGVGPISGTLAVDGATQSLVSFVDNPLDLAKSLEQYVEAYLRPAAAGLARVVGKTGQAPLEPSGVEDTAIGECCGVAVRYVRAYDINEDSMRSRFDVMHS